MNPRVQVVAAAALFSTGGAVIKWCGFDGFQLAALRAAIAGVALLIAMPEARQRWSWRVFVVGLAYAVTTLLFVQANKLTTAANAIFLQSTSPVFILLLAPWLLREPVRRADVVQLVVTALGMTLFFVGGERQFATAPHPGLGNALAAGCAVSWSFTLVGYRWLAARGTSPAAAAVSGNFTACLVAVVAGLPFAPGTAADWAAVSYLGLVQLAVPYMFLARAVPRLRALEVSLFLLVEPVLNPVWAWLVHGETPGRWALVGGVLILGTTLIRARLAPPVALPRATSPDGSAR